MSKSHSRAVSTIILSGNSYVLAQSGHKTPQVHVLKQRFSKAQAQDEAVAWKPGAFLLPHPSWAKLDLVELAMNKRIVTIKQEA